jgi:hypothetical protein
MERRAKAQARQDRRAPTLSESQNPQDNSRNVPWVGHRKLIKPKQQHENKNR